MNEEQISYRVTEILRLVTGLVEQGNEHGRILREHGQILNDHSQILKEHGQKLDNLTQKVDVLSGHINEIGLKGN